MAQDDRVYYNLRTHIEMLNDRRRCLTYQKAIEAVVRDKIVLDVGCGSGILSFFAARAGAKLVFAVDMDIPPGAEEAVKMNGLADRVRFFKGKIQDVTLPVDEVDIIVSEWMGGILLMEDMLPAVLFARDRWLKPGGILLPDQARLFLIPLNDVAGIESSRFPTLRETIASQMWVSVIDPSRFLTEPVCLLDLDLYSVQESGTKTYEAAYRFSLNDTGMFNGFGLWFDVSFNHKVPVTLSTSPHLPPTHWAQGLWILPVDIDAAPGDEVSGTFSQTKVTPSIASFAARVRVTSRSGDKASFNQIIEAAPSNMNASGYDEDRLAEQAMSGAYRGHDCLWIGCSMSFAALMVARNNAGSVSILNYSPWAARAMQQLAGQEGLTNMRFITEVPPPDRLQDKEITILGAIDSSWQALLSHVKVRRLLNRAAFSLHFYREESPWQEFYGFDFSPYAPYDLEMYHENSMSPTGMALRDITGQVAPAPGEIMYRGFWSSKTGESQNLPDGSYNRIKVNFNCGTVVLPLREALRVDSSTGSDLKSVELTISFFAETTCRFELKLSNTAWSLQQAFEQPIAAMGHIVRSS